MLKAWSYPHPHPSFPFSSWKGCQRLKALKAVLLPVTYSPVINVYLGCIRDFVSDEPLDLGQVVLKDACLGIKGLECVVMLDILEAMFVQCVNALVSTDVIQRNFDCLGLDVCDIYIGHILGSPQEQHVRLLAFVQIQRFDESKLGRS